ncbi:TPA: hypothetical protein G8O00_000959 [Salmonella enterica]|uniref:Uncharacterized protein n=1 Tax=Salmonella enterica TaxID=28901 RepID=A0A747XJC4_SALER|nr:hypothetical protein [Salmonella enterica]HAF4697603.1 hypothetical protein [Salmonella enterica]
MNGIIKTGLLMMAGGVFCLLATDRVIGQLSVQNENSVCISDNNERMTDFYNVQRDRKTVMMMVRVTVNQKDSDALIRNDIGAHDRGVWCIFRQEV